MLIAIYPKTKNKAQQIVNCKKLETLSSIQQLKPNPSFFRPIFPIPICPFLSLRKTPCHFLSPQFWGDSYFWVLLLLIIYVSFASALCCSLTDSLVCWLVLFVFQFQFVGCWVQKQKQAMAAKKACESFSKSKRLSLMEEVQRWGCMKQTGVSLRYMMEFGSKPTPKNLLISAHFLHKELPIRIARRAIELENLPYGLSHKPAVLKVRDWYLDSFRDLRSFPEIKNRNDEKEFTEMIKAIKVRHNNVVPTMALGVQQLKKGMEPKIVYEDPDEIHQFLDRFYMSRIGIRMLIAQHVELHNPNPPPNCVGYIHTKMSPMDVARNASEDARAICCREYGSAPDVHIYGDPDFTFPYVPAHLHLMVFELVKNSLRAVQERFMDSDKVAPPIRIVVADGIEDVTIKVSDEGGGIPRSGLPKIFTYLYSTARNPLEEHSDLGTADNVTMAGYGYGLPISRLYARYFGGDLQIISMEGYGTDAYLHLSRLGDSQEPLS